MSRRDEGDGFYRPDHASERHEDRVLAEMRDLALSARQQQETRTPSMKITIRPTSLCTMLDGQRVRKWNGLTSDGVRCTVFVARVAVDETEDAAAFELDLKRTTAPAGDETFIIPLRMVL